MATNPSEIFAIHERLYLNFDEFKNLSSAAERGDVEARNKIAWLAHNGSGISMIHVANGYRTGRCGYETDLEKAAAWYGYAARGGLPHGHHGLGLIEKAKGDYASAMSHFSEAAAHDFAPSINEIALLYYSGLGVTRDIHKARSLLDRGTRLGNVWSKKYLIHIYMSGTYGFGAIIRGALMFWAGLAEIPMICFGDPHGAYSERLRR